MASQATHDPNERGSGKTITGLRRLTIDVLLVTSKVNGLDTANLLLSNSNGRAGSDTSADGGASSGDKGALLDARSRRGQLAGHWRPQGLGEASGGHCDVRAGRGEELEMEGRLFVKEKMKGKERKGKEV